MAHDFLAHLANMIERAGRNRFQVVPMAWAYFDETMEQQPDHEGGPKQMTTLAVCGCAASKTHWDAFTQEWQDALRLENLSAFHATDFYAFKKEFEWLTPDGKPDWDRQTRVRRKLASIIVRHVDRIVGHFNQPRPNVGKRRSIKDTYMKGVDDAIMGEVKDWAAHEPICIVFARNPNMSPWSIIRRFENLDWDGRLRGCGVFYPEDVLALQAADFLCHALLRRYIDRRANEAFEDVLTGMKEREKPVILSVRAAEYPNGGGYFDEPPRQC